MSNVASKTYFFWNDKPYKVLAEHKRKNIVEVYDIAEQKKLQLPWTMWKKHRRPAFTTIQAAKILGRHHIRVRLWMTHGLIPRPFAIEDIDGEKREFGENKKLNHLWTEDDIYVALEYMESTGHKDVPSRAEVQALINQDKLIQYIRDDKTGEFYPVWVAD